MNAEPDLARLASTVGDPRRIQMLALLMEGRALTAKEMVLGAGIEPATATSHLKRLLDDGLLVSTSQGRHKYFRLASEQVAQLLEALMRVAPPRQRAATTTPADEPIRQARYCYDHLAGTRAKRRQWACRCLDWSERRDHLGGALGAALAEHLLAQRWIERKQHSRVVFITDLGQAQLGQIGLNLPS